MTALITFRDSHSITADSGCLWLTDNHQLMYGLLQVKSITYLSENPAPISLHPFLYSPPLAQKEVSNVPIQ